MLDAVIADLPDQLEHEASARTQPAAYPGTLEMERLARDEFHQRELETQSLVISHVEVPQEVGLGCGQPLWLLGDGPRIASVTEPALAPLLALCARARETRCGLASHTALARSKSRAFSSRTS